MEHQCPVCANKTIFLGVQKGKLDSRNFNLRHCENCRLSFIEDFRTDYENIYNEDYYHGAGADPMVDYVYELDNKSKTIRNYEWKGIFEIYSKLCPKGGRWLDFGCGGGGLVNFARVRGVDAVGVEDGWAADKGRLSGTPILHTRNLKDYTGSFDFISAIEVLEHVSNPVDALMQIRKLLKPGGVIFITTGNAQPWRNKLLDWGYTKCPDVHISFYEPKTLEMCLKKAGFQAKHFSFSNGFVEIIKYKVLKTLKVKDMNKLIDMLPWGLITRVVDVRHKVSKQPYGVAIEN